MNNLMIRILTLIIFIILIFFRLDQLYAKNLEVPRFVSLASNEINVRHGDNTDRPINWIYINLRGLPVEIIQESDNWRKIRDFKNNIGWIHTGLLSGKRFVITKDDIQIIYKQPYINEKIVARAKKNVLLEIEKCTTYWCLVKKKIQTNKSSSIMSMLKCNKIYCLINSDIIKGWINKDYIWGVYSHEIID